MRLASDLWVQKRLWGQKRVQFKLGACAMVDYLTKPLSRSAPPAFVAPTTILYLRL
jgi:hypothetical protein